MAAKAKINPAMMKWARAYAGFINGYEEKLPKDIKSKYKSWENGEKLPTWNQLRNVSKKYKVPTAFFFMNNPPKSYNFPELIDYRRSNIMKIVEKDDKKVLSFDDKQDLDDNFVKCMLAINSAQRDDKYKNNCDCKCGDD